MNDFLNRVDAQRMVLAAVNARSWSEPLFGLSRGAIDRWRVCDSAIPAELLLLVEEAAGRLFFLANKSQEQVTEEYRIGSQDMALVIARIQSEFPPC